MVGFAVELGEFALAYDGGVLLRYRYRLYPTAPQRAALAIDRTAWPRTGASALYRAGKGWETIVAHPAGYDRPWARAVPAVETPATASRPAPRDATPRAEDLAPDD